MTVLDRRVATSAGIGGLRQAAKIIGGKIPVFNAMPIPLLLHGETIEFQNFDEAVKWMNEYAGYDVYPPDLNPNDHMTHKKVVSDARPAAIVEYTMLQANRQQLVDERLYQLRKAADDLFAAAEVISKFMREDTLPLQATYLAMGIVKKEIESHVNRLINEVRNGSK